MKIVIYIDILLDFFEHVRFRSTVHSFVSDRYFFTQTILIIVHVFFIAYTTLTSS